MKSSFLKAFFAFSMLGFLLIHPYSWADDDVDLFKRFRYTFGSGFFLLNYSEQHQYQSEASGHATLMGPTLWASGSFWFLPDKIELFTRGELMGFEAQGFDAMGGLKLHLYTSVFHFSLGGGVEEDFRYQPNVNLGYENVILAYVQPALGIPISLMSAKPKEFVFFARYGRPFTGGDVSFSESHQIRLGVQARFPLDEPEIDPVSLYEKVFFIEPFYEYSSYQFDMVRTVTSVSKNFQINFGFDF